MTSRTLQAVLRSLSEAAPAADDGELLRRFVAGDEDAFAELVRRHGQLVWAVCRHLTGSDAEADDAFQATFLVLLKSAGKIRDAGRLSAWLHGVAYRVSAKARQVAKRRAARERATAHSERNGSAVADSAWDRALAAVHEEVGRLPETLRVPFVLCCLEGKGVTEAAEQLGWKLGTFSGRLTRAKDAVLARLDARGFTLGVAAGVGLASPPAAALAKATALVRVGFVVPNSVLQLTQGVIGMGTTSFKVLAAAVLLTCGLGFGAGTGWVATADAQSPGKVPPPKTDPDAEVKRLQAELDKARQAAAAAKSAAGTYLAQQQQGDLAAALAALDALVLAGQNSAPSAKTSKWEYDFVVVSDLTEAKFFELLQDHEKRGWEYNGMTKFRHKGMPVHAWLFRRPAKGASGYSELLGQYWQLGQNRKVAPSAELPPATQFKNVPPLLAGNVAGSDDPKVVEAEIARLQQRLAALKAKPARDRVVFAKKDLPLEPAELTELLLKLAGKKFKNAQFTFTPTGTGLIVDGDKEVLDWAAAMIKKLGEK